MAEGDLHLGFDNVDSLARVLVQALSLMRLVEEAEDDVPEGIYRQALEMRAMLTEHGVPLSE